ncbi:conserved domain protein [Actinomyces sp. oral taxon 170 str. F0386]|nr:conserved domain protein [Actinomyces sp. oral taxon 170 str. F0386]
MTTAPLPLPGAAPSSCSPVRSRVGRRWAMSRLDVVTGPFSETWIAPESSQDADRGSRPEGRRKPWPERMTPCPSP